MDRCEDVHDIKLIPLSFSVHFFVYCSGSVLRGGGEAMTYGWTRLSLIPTTNFVD